MALHAGALARHFCISHADTWGRPTLILLQPRPHFGQQRISTFSGEAEGFYPKPYPRLSSGFTSLSPTTLASPPPPELFVVTFSIRQDIPVVDVNIRGDHLYYLLLLSILAARESLIAPLHVGVEDQRQVPTTPLPNPGSSLSSHHRLRLFDYLEPRFRVELLFRDEDLYFVGFRCEDDGEWSVWFHFSDVALPDFLPSQPFDMTSDHGSRTESNTGGSIICMVNMFYAFVNFSSQPRVNLQFRKGIYSVIILYCEARRLASVRKLMSGRIASRTAPELIKTTYWEKINDWDSLGTVVLDAFKAHRLSLLTPVPGWCHKSHADISNLEDLIGTNGELLLIKLNKSDLNWTSKKMKDTYTKKGAGNVPNPLFELPPGFNIPQPEGENEMA